MIAEQLFGVNEFESTLLVVGVDFFVGCSFPPSSCACSDDQCIELRVFLYFGPREANDG